jgi:tetratricopeptide (TPR) repeat protein
MKNSVLLSFALLVSCGGGGSGPAPQGEPVAPVLTGMGAIDFPIAARRPEAQRFFNQGLALVYAFNHDEAARAFREAARQDPECAMAYWGLALAVAPNINDPVPSPEREQEAFEAMAKAKELASKASPTDRDMIAALAGRFSAAKGKDRYELNKKYAAAMKGVAAKYPNHVDAQALYADSVMNTMPWDYWSKDGTPREGIPEIIALVERSIARWPDHTGLNHLYIHLVEASNAPEKAVSSAERLASLAPSAGHLVHMPAHIFVRVGRYADSAATNTAALKADDSYLTQCRMQGLYPAMYHPHNWHFLVVSNMMLGDAQGALEAARKMAGKVQHQPLKQAEFAVLQYWYGYASAVMARFGMWDEILKEPKPDPDLLWTTAVWHYARGLAHTGKNQLGEARAELARMNAIAAKPEFGELMVSPYNSMKTLAMIAASVLEGEIAARQKQYGAAISHFERATRLEDSLTYNEPPDWYYPVRHSLGAVLLEAGRPAEAEAVYWEDLRRNPSNGWSLFGLWKSLEAQSKTERAAEAGERFKKAWAGGGVPLRSSRIL